MLDSRAQCPTQARGSSDRERAGVAQLVVRPKWSRPRLVDHGDVRELTLGATSGNFESGVPGTFRP